MNDIFDLYHQAHAALSPYSDRHEVYYTSPETAFLYWGQDSPTPSQAVLKAWEQALAPVPYVKDRLADGQAIVSSPMLNRFFLRPTQQRADEYRQLLHRHAIAGTLHEQRTALNALVGIARDQLARKINRLHQQDEELASAYKPIIFELGQAISGQFDTVQGRTALGLLGVNFETVCRFNEPRKLPKLPPTLALSLQNAWEELLPRRKPFLDAVFEQLTELYYLESALLNILKGQPASEGQPAQTKKVDEQISIAIERASSGNEKKRQYLTCYVEAKQNHAGYTNAQIAKKYNLEVKDLNRYVSGRGKKETDAQKGFLLIFQEITGNEFLEYLTKCRTDK